VAITFDTQSDTTVLNRTKVNDNFTAINTYLSNGLAVTDAENEYHSFAVTLFTGDLTTAESVIHTIALPGQTSVGATAVLYLIQQPRGGGTSNAGAVKWTYYDSWADAYNNTTVDALLISTTDDDLDGGSITSPTIPSEMNTLVTANSPIYVRVSTATNNAIDICATFWFKVKHANATLES